tara:strand:- start:4863 stop:5393 length:531 start_codon:yes stop_codon:yes gene_type:complete
MKEIFESFNYQGLLEILEEKNGKKFVMKNADLFYLWYCVQRKMVKENREMMIKYLSENNILDDNRSILETVDRYFKVKNILPELNEPQQRRLDKGNQLLNPVVPFQKIGNRMLGIIDSNNESYSVVDISEGRENKVAILFKKGGISWRNDNLHPFEMKWILEHNKMDLKNKKGILQ